MRDGLRCGGVLVLVCSIMTAACGVAAQSKSSCERPTSLSLPNAVVSVQTVAAGQFVPPAARGGSAAQPFSDLPAFCRVTTTTQAAGSEVKAEIWLPIEGWNRDFQPAGSAFWGGALPYGRMREILHRGAAT